MKRKHRNILLVITSCALSATLLCAAFSSPSLSRNSLSINGVNGSYQLDLSRDNASGLGSEFTKRVETVSRYTGFALLEAKASASGLAVLKGNGQGKVVNTTPITGVSSICATLIGEGELVLYGSKDGKDLTHRLATLKNSVPYEQCLPYAYLVLANESSNDVDLAAISISYTCSPNEITGVDFVCENHDVQVGSGIQDLNSHFHVNYSNGRFAELATDPSLLQGYTSEAPGERTAHYNLLGWEGQFVYHVVQNPKAVTLAIGESHLADFDDARHRPGLVLDNSQTPNTCFSSLKETSVDGSGHLYFESDGSFASVYIKDFVSFEANAVYRITFDYIVHVFSDTIYFQVSGPNAFTQFGSPSSIGKKQTFSWIYSSEQAADTLMIFPGAALGKTRVSLDLLRVERIAEEKNVKPVSMSNSGDRMLETFGDPTSEVFRADFAPAPSSSIVSEGGIQGNSLKLVSSGAYAGVYLVPFDKTLIQAGDYKLSFDYRIDKLVDTFYLKFYWTGGFFDPAFPNLETGKVHRFEMDFQLSGQIDVLQIFPGGGSGESVLVLDNVALERK